MASCCHRYSTTGPISVPRQLRTRLFSKLRAVPSDVIYAVADASATGQSLQDLLVGGTVLGVVSASIVSGLRKDTVCELCQGTGGASCFGCSGDGKMSLIKRDDLYDKPGAPPRPRDPLGRASRPNECRVCKGVGMLLCSRCKGSGYTSKL
ncbi:hypothetical protein V8C86DRAFT_2449659 [Haematococcus lacustris]|nr:hypothetical protein QJQ45_011582 [Haematococcus lacustris]